MRWLTAARSTLAGWIAPDAGARRIAEAAGATVDRDEAGWTRLTGASERDLLPLTQTRMQDLAAYQWQANLLARQLIELPITFMLARGVRVGAGDADAAAAIRKWWRDPITDGPLRLPEWMRALRLYGELVLPAFVDAGTGHVRLGYIDPGRIETVVWDPENAACPIGLVVEGGRRRRRLRKYRVIYLGAEEMFAARTMEIRAGFGDGEVFYWRKNVLGGGRGRSDLLGAIDWLDAYDRYLLGELDRADFLRAFIWDVEMVGATPDEVRQRAREVEAPAPGSVRVHNESEKWRAESPQLDAYEASAGARLWRNHILGGLGFPEHWFGGGGDVNRATAAEMGDPAHKMLAFEQSMWTEILRRMAEYVVWRYQDPAGRSPPVLAEPDSDLLPTVEWPEMIERDMSRHATALQQTTAAVVVAIDRGLITEAMALRIVAAVAERIGVEIDPAAEIMAAQRESRARADARAEEDTFPPPPPGDE